MRHLVAFSRSSNNTDTGENELIARVCQNVLGNSPASNHEERLYQFTGSENPHTVESELGELIASRTQVVAVGHEPVEFSKSVRALIMAYLNGGHVILYKPAREVDQHDYERATFVQELEVLTRAIHGFENLYTIVTNEKELREALITTLNSTPQAA